MIDITEIKIRRENPEDYAAIRSLVKSAFRTPAESRLVDALRDSGAASLSMVAVIQGKIAGHILYSPATVEHNPENKVIFGLAPLAVLTEFRKMGVGGRLARESLDECRLLCDAVVVLGSPAYYPRFGFQPASKFGLTCEYPVPLDDFMALELTESSLSNCKGLVKYHPLFAELDV